MHQSGAVSSDSEAAALASARAVAGAARCPAGAGPPARAAPGGLGWARPTGPPIVIFASAQGNPWESILSGGNSQLFCGSSGSRTARVDTIE